MVSFTGFCIHTNSSARSVPKKLSSPLGCLSLKKIEEPEDEEEWLQQQGNDLHQDLETAYIAQMCLAWEALNCQYTQLTRKIMCYNENSTCYNHSAQQFQQFQVLLQRYIENEPFAKGLRPEIFARMRNSLPKLLHVPLIQGKRNPCTCILVLFSWKNVEHYVSLCWKYYKDSCISVLGQLAKGICGNYLKYTCRFNEAKNGKTI